MMWGSKCPIGWYYEGIHALTPFGVCPACGEGMYPGKRVIQGCGPSEIVPGASAQRGVGPYCVIEVIAQDRSDGK